MKIRLMFCLILFIIALPITAQDDTADDRAMINIFNSSNVTILVSSLGDSGISLTLAPHVATTFYLYADDQLNFNDAVIPLPDTFLAGHHYAVTYLGGGEYVIHDLTELGTAITAVDTSVWWVGNFLADETASLSVSLNDKVIIENLPHGEWTSFTAPITYFTIAFSVGDVVLYQTDQAFGEPYYTALIAFAGDYTGNLMQDFFAMTLDIIETDFLTWLDALSQAEIAPYIYTTMLRLIADADMQADFLADDRVILLPYDDAFNTLPFDTRMYFFNDEARLLNLLNHHLLIKSDMPNDPSAPITTLSGDELAVGMSSRGLMIDNATYITRLFLPNGSEVWLMNGVILPSIETEE